MSRLIRRSFATLFSSTRTCLAATVRCAVSGLVEGFTPVYTPFLTEEVTQFSQSDEASKAAQAN